MTKEAAASVDGGAAEEPDLDEGRARMEEAPIAADATDDLTSIPFDDVVEDDEGEAPQIHRALPEPKPLKHEAVRKHHLTRCPYRSWCP